MVKSYLSEVNECVREQLVLRLDPHLIDSGFNRKNNSLCYTRKISQTLQKIDLAIEIHPSDRKDAAAAIYPWLDVGIPAVEARLMEMLNHDHTLLPGLSGCTLREPIEFTAAKAAHARWFLFQPDSIPAAIDGMKEFIQKWTIPFLDGYLTELDLCATYDRNDPRVMNDLGQKLRVAAAMVLANRCADALSLMDRWFGKAGPKRKYQSVFEYLYARV